MARCGSSWSAPATASARRPTPKCSCTAGKSGAAPCWSGSTASTRSVCWICAPASRSCGSGAIRAAGRRSKSGGTKPSGGWREEGARLGRGRDPVVVKPLYVGRTNGEWWFASELAAARSCGLVGELKREAFDEYLVYRFVPSPGTFYRNAWKLPPGHLCRFPLDTPPAEPSFAPFVTRFAPASYPDSRGEWEEALRAGLRAAVSRQLMSDVPVGSLLSGGVDSTVVTKLMCEGLEQPPAAFAIGFADQRSLDELGAARRAADVLGVPLTEVAITGAEYLAAWPRFAGELGEPIANSSALMLGLLCRAVQGKRKVVLTGQGADEDRKRT